MTKHPQSGKAADAKGAIAGLPAPGTTKPPVPK
jgi:hypothetical protein